MRFFRIFLASCLLPGAMIAQQYPFFRPPPEDPKNKVTVSYRHMMPVDVTFSNLGSIPFRDPVQTGSAGQFQGRDYNDGFVWLDTTYGIGIETDGLTSYFGYRRAEQVEDNQLFLHQHASASEGRGFSDDADGGGWEIAVTRELPRWENVSWTIALGFNHFTIEDSGGFTATLLRRRDVYDFGDLPIPPAIPSSASGVRGYRGTQTRMQPGPDSPGRPQPLAPVDPVHDAFIELPPVPGGVEGRGRWELSSTFYTIRTGPLYDWNPWRGLHLQVGAGLASVFYHGDFFADESFRVGENERSFFFGTERNSEWLLGGYVDVNIAYRVSDRVGVFGGAQYQTTGDFRGRNGERQVTVDMGGTLFITVGMSIRF